MTKQTRKAPKREAEQQSTEATMPQEQPIIQQEQAVPEPPAINVVDKTLQLMETLETLKEQAIGELLAQRREIEDKLERLGWEEPRTFSSDSRLITVPHRPLKAGAVDPSKPCPKCGKLGHDGRFHRYQKEQTNGTPAVPTGDPPTPV